MKKMILVLALLGFSAAAQARGYQQEVQHQRVCAQGGKVVMALNQAKAAGVTKEEALVSFKDYFPESVEKVYAGDLSDQDAFMAGWAECMDRNFN